MSPREILSEAKNNESPRNQRRRLKISAPSPSLSPKLRPPASETLSSFQLSAFQILALPAPPLLRSLCLFAAKTLRSREPRNTRKPTKSKTPTKDQRSISPKIRPPASETLSSFQLSAFPISALPIRDLRGFAVKSSIQRTTKHTKALEIEDAD